MVPPRLSCQCACTNWVVVKFEVATWAFTTKLPPSCEVILPPCIPLVQKIVKHATHPPFVQKINSFQHVPCPRGLTLVVCASKKTLRQCSNLHLRIDRSLNPAPQTARPRSHWRWRRRRSCFFFFKFDFSFNESKGRHPFSPSHTYIVPLPLNLNMERHCSARKCKL